MTTVDLSVVARGLGTSLVGTSAKVYIQAISNEKNALFLEDDKVIFTKGVTINLTPEANSVTIDLKPTDGTFCYRWRITGTAEYQTLNRHTAVPDSTETIDFADLIDVDPKTFVPSEEATAAWTAIVEEVIGHRSVVAGLTAETRTLAAAVNQDKIAAGLSAGDAAGSAGDAYSSARESAHQAGLASGSAGQAAGSESNADASAKAAAQSKTNAGNEAAAAGRSATAASESARLAESARVSVDQSRTAIEQIQTDVGETKVHIDEAVVHVDQVKVDVDNTHSQITTLKSDITVLDQHITEVQSENVISQGLINQSKTEIYQARDDTLTAKQSVDQSKADVTATKSAVDQVKTDVIAAKNSVDQTKTDVIQLKSDVNVAKGSVDQTKTDVTQLKTDVTQLKTDTESARNETVVTVGTMPDWGSISATLTQAATKSAYLKRRLTGNPSIGFAAGVANQAYSCTLELLQDGTGNRTLILVNVATPFGLPIPLSTAAGAIDIIRLEWNGTRWSAYLGGAQMAVPSAWVV